MLQLLPQLRILIGVEPVDFRRGLDSLIALCRKQYSQDPFSGSLYVFRNRAGTAVKIICYDGVGFYLVYRRYSRGRLQWWPESDEQVLQPLAAQQLAVLLAQGNPLNAAFPENWRKIG